MLDSIAIKEIESKTLDLYSGGGKCGSFVHVDLKSNTLDLCFGEEISNITHLILRTRRRRRKIFLQVGLVLQVEMETKGWIWFCHGWVWFCR